METLQPLHLHLNPGNGTFTPTTTTTGVTQSTVAPTGGSGATFTFVTDGNGRIDTVSVTGGGSTYSR